MKLEKKNKSKPKKKFFIKQNIRYGLVKNRYGIFFMKWNRSFNGPI